MVFALVCKMGLSRAKRHRLKVREQLFDHFRSRSKLSERNIADRVGCDRRTVARWRKKFAEDPENIEDDDRSGRPFKLLVKDQRRVLRSLRTRANSTVRKAHKLVADKVSEATVRRLAHRNRLQYGKPKRAAISEANVEARLKATTPAKVRLMQRHLHVLLCMDEKLIMFKPDNLVRGQKTPLMWSDADRPRPPQKAGFHVMRFYGGILVASDGTVYKMGVIFADDGKALNAQRLIKTVLKPAQRFLEETVPGDKQKFALLDNASIHTAATTKAWCEKNNFKLHPHPAQSPDLNPIEKCWAEMVAGMENKRPRTEAGAVRMVQKLWDNLPDAHVASYVNALPGVMRQVHKKPGVHVTH